MIAFDFEAISVVLAHGWAGGDWGTVAGERRKMI